MSKSYLCARIKTDSRWINLVNRYLGLLWFGCFVFCHIFHCVFCPPRPFTGGARAANKIFLARHLHSHLYLHFRTYIYVCMYTYMCFWFDKIHLIWFQIDKIWFHLVMSNKENWMEVKWLSKQESSTYMLEPEIWQKRKKIGGFFLLTEISSYFVLKQISSLFCWTLVVVGFNRSYLRHPPFTFSPKPKAKVWHKSWKKIMYICIFVYVLPISGC